jgi:DNA-binding transcriptional ArsR family regulator
VVLLQAGRRALQLGSIWSNVHIEMSRQARDRADEFPFEPMAAIFKVLGDPTRLQLLQAMSLECKSVSRLVAESGLPQPIVSHHLRILRDAGLARAERHGAYKFY